jgi:hypothetical protein
MAEHELFDFMQESSKKIQAEYSRISKRSLEDAGTAGDEGEENWRSLIQRWLPQSYHLVTKGRILFQNDMASPQMDVLVLSPEYPRGLIEEGEKLYVAGGVLAAFECKLTARREHIARAFETARELSKGIGKRSGSPYRELHRPIIYGLLAHSHVWKSKGSQPLDNVTLSLNEELNALEHPREMPDLFCASDLGTWSALKHARSGSWESSHRGGFVASPGGRGIAGSYGVRRSHEQGPRAVTNVGAMVINLMCRLAWERTELRQLVNHFRLVQGATALFGQGEKTWEVEQVFSEMLVQKLARHGKAALKVPTLAPSDTSPWNEWDWIFGGG